MADNASIKNLCYLINDKNEVLLQYKKRGFGVGKWNGPGGKAEPGETSEEAAAREIKEETGFDLVSYERKAELEFYFKGREDWDHTTHVYVAKAFSGEMKASDEGELKWFGLDDIPFNEMWDDDPHWLKRVLGGEYVTMRFYFDENGKLLNFEPL